MAAEPGHDFRWGIVLRRSQLNADGTEGSTDRQELEVVRHIRNNNMGVIVQSYKDIASGWKPGTPRPRYKHALVDLASGAIDGIAVLNIDRLTRRKDQILPILNALEAMGGRLFSLEDELDTADECPGGNTELRFHELVERAEREARRTSERMKLMAKHRSRKGQHQPGSRRPFGHSTDWHSLVPHEAELVNEAALRVAGGEAVFRVAKDWTERGIPTATGKLTWQHDVLRQILLSARMVGKRAYDGALIELPDVPAILPEPLWRQVREKLASRRKRTGRMELRQLSNILLCGVCGLTLIGDFNKGISVYKCRKRPAAPEACGGIDIQTAKVDARVDAEVVRFLNDKRRMKALLDQHRLRGPELEAIDARYAELQDNKMTLEEAAFDPPAGVERLPRERYWELRTQIEDEQEWLQRRRVVNREAGPLEAALKQTWTVETWRGKPLEYRRAILKLATERIEVARDVKHGGGRKGLLGGQHDPDRIKVKFAA